MEKDRDTTCCFGGPAQINQCNNSHISQNKSTFLIRLNFFWGGGAGILLLSFEKSYTPSCFALYKKQKVLKMNPIRLADNELLLFKSLHDVIKMADLKFSSTWDLMADCLNLACFTSILKISDIHVLQQLSNFI